MYEARDENRQYWDERTKDSSIRRGMVRVNLRVEMLLEGKERSQMIVTPPGCGKDTAVFGALERSGRKHLTISKTTAAGLRADLDRSSREKLIAVINDSDASIWKNTEAIEVLMRATGDLAGRTDRRSVFRNEEVYDYTDASIIILSNRNPFSEGATTQVIQEGKLPALFRRMQLTVVEASREERYEYTCYLIICENILRRMNTAPAIVNEVLTVFARNRQLLIDLSPGVIKQMIALREVYGDRWQFMFEDYTRTKYAEPPELGRIPMLVGVDRAKRKVAA